MKFIKSLKGEDDGTADDPMLKAKKRPPPPFTPGSKSQFGLPTSDKLTLKKPMKMRPPKG
jgi:hypothetical protein